MRPKPECKKCAGRHWYFVKCENAEAYAAKEKPKPEPVATIPVLPVYTSSLDRTFRSRLTTLDSTAPNVYWRKKEQ
jgi:hypothetical protein